MSGRKSSAALTKLSADWLDGRGTHADVLAPPHGAELTLQLSVANCRDAVGGAALLLLLPGAAAAGSQIDTPVPSSH